MASRVQRAALKVLSQERTKLVRLLSASSGNLSSRLLSSNIAT